MTSTVFDSLARKRQYRFPYIFLGLYLTFLLATVCLANKLTLIGDMILPGGIFVFPFTFVICDIVGEVYGYAYPRLFIWIGVISEMIFSVTVIAVSHTPVPTYYNHAGSYVVVFDPTIRYVFSGLIGLLVGEFVDIYLLSKWKLALRGKYFIIRSLSATAIGQASLTIIVDVLNYTGKMPIPDLIHMMYSGYGWKIISAAILVFPAWMLTRYLKQIEQIDHFDINTNFNPFILRLDDSLTDKDNAFELSHG